MKKLIYICSFIFLFTYVNKSANAKDPCASLICMSGLVGNGTPSGGCSKPISDYFSIIVWTVTGYHPYRTAIKRQRYLMSCSGSAANMQWVALIQAQWGMVF